jgi:hypothetical protein
MSRVVYSTNTIMQRVTDIKNNVIGDKYKKKNVNFHYYYYFILLQF